MPSKTISFLKYMNQQNLIMWKENLYQPYAQKDYILP